MSRNSSGEKEIAGLAGVHRFVKVVEDHIAPPMADSMTVRKGELLAVVEEAALEMGWFGWYATQPLSDYVPE